MHSGPVMIHQTHTGFSTPANQRESSRSLGRKVARCNRKRKGASFGRTPSAFKWRPCEGCLYSPDGTPIGRVSMCVTTRFNDRSMHQASRCRLRERDMLDWLMVAVVVIVLQAKVNFLYSFPAYQVFRCQLN